MSALIAKGLKFKFGKYRIRIWHSGFEIGTETYGRVYLAPWHRLKSYEWKKEK